VSLSSTSHYKAWHSYVAALGIIGALLGVYHNSFYGPFVFDDIPAILENPTIRNLSDIALALSPPHGKGFTVEGRPLLNLSLAFNYALSGTDVWSYHLVNLVIHALASLCVLGIVRLTLVRIKDFVTESEALMLGFICALIWAIHPLQTESVTYVIQRAESLMGLFYLATIYFFIKATDKKSSVLWIYLSALSCLAGMASKEVMISAPVTVLIYDWVINANSIKDALKKRLAYYAALFASSIVLLVLALGTGTRGGTSGFGIDITPWTYWKTQFGAIWNYVSLVFWPKNLVFDYGVEWVNHVVDILPYIIFLSALVAVSAYYFIKRTKIGLLAFFFFAILAPTSVMPGNRQIMAEHRMYLPLLSVIALCVCGSYYLLKLKSTKVILTSFLFLCGIISVALGVRTYIRNDDYKTVVSIYEDTVLRRPQNGYAHYNLGKLYAESGKEQQAIVQYKEAIKYGPNTEQAHYNLGNTYSDLGRLEEAILEYQAAIRLNNTYSKAHYNLGNVLIQLGRLQEALQEFTFVTQIKPDYLEARDNRGGVLLELGRYAEAEAQFLYVINKNPNVVGTHMNLGNAYRFQGKHAKALEQFEIALQLDPKFEPAKKARDELRALLDESPRN